MKTLKDYVVTARNEETGCKVVDIFYVANEYEAREDFRACYRNATYTILSVTPPAGALTDEEYKQLAQIAREQIPGLEGRPNLDAMNSDELDFIDGVSVWSLEAALAAAYKLGKAAGREEAKQ